MSSHLAGLKETIAVAGAGTYLSAALNVKMVDQIGYAVRADAGPVTSTAVTVLYSNDYTPGVDSPTDLTKWDTYTPATTPPSLTGSAQKFGIVLDLYEFAWVRLQFAVSSGSGNVFVAANGKGE